MKRRDFLFKSSLFAVGTVLSFRLPIDANSDSDELIILHTNDTHSAIDPFPSDHPKYPGMGGVVNRAALIALIREKHANVLLLDAGDIFQGTPYFNLFKGEVEMKAMAAMGYDVGTLGNHDFDIGIQGFLTAYRHAGFPLVNANYALAGTPLEHEVVPNIIIRKGKFKVGIFGLGIDLNELVSPELWKGVVYQDPIVAAQQQVTELRKKGCNLIVCLSHLGYRYENSDQVSDCVLASQTTGIDIIIGGHTHTFMETPALVKDLSGKEVLIHQVGFAGIYLGQIHITPGNAKTKRVRVG